MPIVIITGFVKDNNTVFIITNVKVALAFLTIKIAIMIVEIAIIGVQNVSPAAV
jgi:hypothetical protein